MFMEKYSDRNVGFRMQLDEIPVRCLILDDVSVVVTTAANADFDPSQFETMIKQGPWSSLLALNLGANYIIVNAEYHKHRRTRNQRWHRDLNNSSGIFMINLVIAFTNTGVSNGRTEIFLPNTSNPIGLDAKRGHWYAFNSELIHRASKNCTNNPRRILIVQCVREEHGGLGFNQYVSNSARKKYANEKKVCD